MKHKYIAIYYNLYCNTLENIFQCIRNFLIHLKIYNNIWMDNLLLYIHSYIYIYVI